MLRPVSIDDATKFNMNIKKQFSLITLLGLLALTAIGVSANAAKRVAVPRWQPHDFVFKSDVKVANPFKVEFTAEVKDPVGKAFMLPGFFDGNGSWKVRVSPNTEGAWSLVTKSDVRELDGKSEAFICVKNASPNAHGRLRVDQEHPHHFILEDGTHFFMQGYEYDWLWALDMDQSGVPTVEKSLDLIARHCFNYVLLNSYAYDTDWRKGKSAPDDYGPPLLYP